MSGGSAAARRRRWRLVRERHGFNPALAREHDGGGLFTPPRAYTAAVQPSPGDFRHRSLFCTRANMSLQSERARGIERQGGTTTKLNPRHYSDALLGRIICISPPPPQSLLLLLGVLWALGPCRVARIRCTCQPWIIAFQISNCWRVAHGVSAFLVHSTSRFFRSPPPLICPDL